MKNATDMSTLVYFFMLIWVNESGSVTFMLFLWSLETICYRPRVASNCWQLQTNI